MAKMCTVRRRSSWLLDRIQFRVRRKSKRQTFIAFTARHSHALVHVHWIGRECGEPNASAVYVAILSLKLAYSLSVDFRRPFAPWKTVDNPIEPNSITFAPYPTIHLETALSVLGRLGQNGTDKLHHRLHGNRRSNELYFLCPPICSSAYSGNR